MSSAHRIGRDLYRAYEGVGAGIGRDPGASGTITPIKWGEFYPIVTATAETRTLSQPSRPGVLTTVCLSEDGGDMTLTVSGGYNNDDDTAIVFGDAGDMVVFLSIQEGTSFFWRVIAQEGTDVAVEEGVFDSLTATTLTSTTATIATVAHTATDLNEHAAGAIGTSTAPNTTRYTRDGVIITDIKIDLTGLSTVATANDVVALTAGGLACYIGQYIVATYGVVFRIEMICLETPLTGDNDVNVVLNSSGSLIADGAAGTAYGVDGGDGVAGQTVEDLVQGLTTTR